MRWTKIVLLFQAVITLIFGMIFFAQVLALDMAKVSELNIQVGDPNVAGESTPEYIDIKQRYSAASYVLLLLSLLELIIISRLIR